MEWEYMNRVDIQSISSRIQSNNINNSRVNVSNTRSFDEILNQIGQANEELKFSKHVKERMNARNISLSNEDLDKMKSAIDKADKKGIKEALLLMDNKAFIASVKTKTIITSVNTDQLKDSIFTNIDGAIII